MKIDYRNKLWRTREGKLERISQRLEDTAQAVRYAQKPYDLVFPTTRLNDLTNEIRDMQWDWIAELLTKRKDDKCPEPMFAGMPERESPHWRRKTPWMS